MQPSIPAKQEQVNKALCFTGLTPNRGLNTVNLSTLNTVQQIMLFVLIMIGSSIFVSIFVVHIRKQAFERKFESVVKKARAQSGRGLPLSLSKTFSRTFSRSATRARLEDNVIPVQLSKTGEVPDENQTASSNLEIPVPDRASDSREKGQIQDPQSQDPQPLENTDIVGPSNESSLQGAIQWATSARPSSDQEISSVKGTENARYTSPTLTYRSHGGDEIQVNPNETTINEHGPPDHITFGPDVYFRKRHDAVYNHPDKHRLLSMQGVGAIPTASIKPRRLSQSTTRPEGDINNNEKLNRDNSFPMIDQIARNSQFHHLTTEEREKLGGYEYRAIQFLAWIVPVYFVLFQFFGCIGIGAYVAINKPSVAERNGINPWSVPLPLHVDTFRIL
jgi:hypothetical protein